MIFKSLTSLSVVILMRPLLCDTLMNSCGKSGILEFLGILYVT